MSVFRRIRAVKGKNGNVYYYASLEVRWREGGKMRSKTINLSSRNRADLEVPHIELDRRRDAYFDKLGIEPEVFKGVLPKSFEVRNREYQGSRPSAKYRAEESYAKLRDANQRQYAKYQEKVSIPKGAPTPADEAARADAMAAKAGLDSPASDSLDQGDQAELRGCTSYTR